MFYLKKAPDMFLALRHFCFRMQIVAKNDTLSHFLIPQRIAPRLIIHR